MKIKRLSFCLFIIMFFMHGRALTALAEDNSVPDVLIEYLDAINQQDWESFIHCHAIDMRSWYDGFPSAHLVENRQGLLSVDHIEIYEMKQVPISILCEIENRFNEIDFEKYEDLIGIYVGLDYDVQKEFESEFFHNGVKYHFIIVGLENGSQVIVGAEEAFYANLLIEREYGFGSDAEKAFVKSIEYRRIGSKVRFEHLTFYDVESETYKLRSEMQLEENFTSKIDIEDILESLDEYSSNVLKAGVMILIKWLH